MRKTRLLWLLAVVLAGFAALILQMHRRAVTPAPKPKTVADRVAEFGPKVDVRLAPLFAARGVAYPPKRLALLGFKSEKQLEVWAGDADAVLKFVCAYP